MNLPVRSLFEPLGTPEGGILPVLRYFCVESMISLVSSSVQSPSAHEEARRSSPWCLIAVFAAALLASPLSSVAQETRTQQVQLEEGWNLVSLHVRPADSAFASIFGANADQIAMVKNEDGEVYAPDEGIDQITTWKAEEGYQIHAEAPTTLEVTGTAVRADSTSIVLKEGGNIVPYLPASVQAVAPALTSVRESLVAVEEGGGARYTPSTSSPALDSLRPGQAYKVYVDQADTLRYPLVVPTLAEAKGLKGVEVGTTVRMQGYHEPGDGGGGTFKVTNSDAETDGGTVFAFEEDISTEKSHTTIDKGNGLTAPVSVGNTDLVWGTVEVQYGDTESQSLGTKFLHGHSTGTEQYDWIDHKNGTVGSSGARFRNVREWYNDDPDGPFTIRYKRATSDRRLERQNVGNAVSIEWWGAKEADSQSPVNNWWRIAYAINEAAEIYENQSVNWAYVDIPGKYYYRYTIRIREGVKLRGASDQTFGQAANGQSTHGKLKIMPGMAMNHQKDGWKDNHVHMPLRMHEVDLTHAHMTSKVGMERLEVDGNVSNNLAPIENPNGEYSDVQSKLQNGNQWNGFGSKAVNSWETPDGAVAEFNDVYIHDFPGNGIGMNNALDFSPSSNVRVGGAPRNHQLYRTNGQHDSWTIEGSGWSSILKVTKGAFADLKITPEPNTLNQYWSTTWLKVFDHHGKGFGADWFAEQDFRDGLKISVDGFSVDLTNEPRENVGVIRDRGYGGTYRNGTVLSTPTKRTTLISPVSTNGNGPIREYTYEDITITDQGGGVSLWGGEASTHNEVKNVTVQAASGVEYSARGLMGIRMADPTVFAEKDQGSDVPLAMAARLDVTGLDVQEVQKHWIITPQGNGQMPYDLFLEDSFIENELEDVLGGERSRGILYGKNPSHFRLYLDNTTFNVWSARPSYRPDGFHKYVLSDEQRIRLRNAQDQQGRVSDDSGTYTSDANDEGNDYVLIPTDLMSLAQETEVSVTSGNRVVTSVENADANGNVQTFDPENPQAFDPRDPYLRVNLDSAIQTGSTIELEWTARVTPLSDYQTTGVFVARPVSNQSYASGAGPWTLDLRGVAASQESKAPIEYTASSGDTGVVSATVTSAIGPDGDEHSYMLELTEQGTGTTTVTITGSIDGVGTTTDTFEVSIE